MNIISIFNNVADNNTDDAIVCGSERVSYQSLDQRSNQVAKILNQKGVRAGDLVGISAERRTETIIGILAILKLGCSYVPLPNYYPLQRLQHIIRAANIQTLVGDVFDDALIESESLNVVSYSQCAAQANDTVKTDIAANDIAYVMFTSGSTGTPKGVVVPHRAVVRLVVDQNFMQLDKNQRILQNSPIAFDASTLEIWGALLNGGTLIIPEEQELTLRGLGEIIKESEITTTWMTAGLFHAMADERPDDFKSLQQLLTGGDVVSPVKVAQVKQHCPTLTIINGYGPTENTTFTCCHSIEFHDLSNGQPLPIGKPINGTEVFVLDEQLQRVDTGMEGELYVGGQGLALGYLGLEELTQKTFVSAPWDKNLLLYRTGDLVRQDEQGVVHYLGRRDKQVKIRGFRIELGEIEVAMESYKNVGQAAVVAKASVDGADKRLIGYYVENDTIKQEEFLQHIVKSLPDYSIPSQLIKISAMPLNANGKIDRNKLLHLANDTEQKDHFSDHLNGAISGQQESRYRQIEPLIIRHLKEILDLSSIDVTTNFFDLGASSLHIARLHERLEKALNKTVRITDLFLHSNVQSLSVYLSDDLDINASLAEDNKTHEENADDQIAIIGMSGRFPGASNVDEFWNALVEGKELISHFTDDELDINLSESEDGSDYVNARGIMENADLFDAQHFGISPKDAEKMDPQHRIMLEVAQEALDDAGYDPQRYSGNIGVFAGNSQNSYLLNNLVSAPGAARAFAAGYPVKDFSILFGNDKDFNVTRIAYKLNLRGPAVNVQCACSTSLVAVAQACQSLKQRTSDIALAGGVSITFPQKRPYLYTPDGMASADGHCRTFDADATGTVFGDGAGIVVLKRLKDALADGDDVVAVIRGYSMNNDGSDKIGYAAPSIKAQADVIQSAHQAAGIDARSIGYVEAHGTGTPLGDPIEFAALQHAFGAATADTGFCAIGTAKTNVGHLDIAAGVTGLIKTALTLKKGVIPPLLHYKSSNPNIDFESSAFYPVTDVKPWLTESHSPRRAGVSAFGVGGTNIHMVLEESPVTTQILSTEASVGLQVYPLSASSEAALEASVKALGEWAASHNEASTAGVLHSLRHRRSIFDYRAVLVAKNVNDLALAAEQYSGKGIKGISRDKLVMILPGQGSQHVGMARELYQQASVFREALALCANLLEPEIGCHLIDVIYPPAAEQDKMTELLKDTRIAQPAIFSIEYALSKQWADWGVRPDILMGHSIGELASACIADVIDIKDALKLIALRGQLMSDLPKGTMISVRASEEEIAPYLHQGMDLAAVNGPKACVVAGSESAALILEEALANAEIVSSRLHTSHAFHSHMMDPIVDVFKQAIEKVQLKHPKIPIFSTVTSDWLSEDQATDPEYWASHMRRPVRFYDGLCYLWEQEEKCVFLEVGPGKTLSTLANQNPNRKTLKDKVQPSFASLPHAKDQSSDDYKNILETFGQLWASGYTIDWNHLPHSDEAVTSLPAPRHVKLPTYPFQRKRFWVEPVDASHVAVDDSDCVDDTNVNSESKGTELSVADSLRELLSELSGFDPEDMDGGLSFLEMGFDSLLLTQAIKELSDRFGIKVTLRQLIDGFDTLDDLSAHIEQEGTYQGRSQTSTSVTDNSATETIAAKASPTPSSAPVTTIEHHDVGHDLNPTQRVHIDELVQRYNEKTKQSKALTQEYRSYHADPRTASGFNRLWKEIVYQIVTVKSKGSRLIDVDGNEYIDILNGFGPGFLGHSPDHVIESLHQQVDAGFEVGPQSLVAMEAAQLFCEVTGNDRASFVCTGSEAVYAAMRLARTCTSRDKIVMFARDYHGNFDEVLVRGIDGKNGPRTMPLAPGIPRDAVNNVIVLPYGSPQALDYIRQHADQLAAVMVEPVQSRRPEFQPVEFIREVRAITRQSGTLFIFDEVVTGFRFGPKGAQEFYGVDADLVTYGKVIGGGMPLGVVSGKAEYMDTFDGGQWQYGDDSFPEAPVTFFAGTFVRHPLVMASLKSMLNFFKSQPAHFWKAVNAKGDKLAGTVDRWFADNDMPFQMKNCGSLMYLRIEEDQKYGALLGAHMRDRGVFILEGFPSYMTAAHDDEDINYVIDAFKDSALEMQAGDMITGRDKSANRIEEYHGPSISCVPPRLSLPDGEEKISQAMSMPLAAPPILMTEAQKEIWLAVKFGGDSANLAYNESLSLHFTGPFDQEVFSQSLNQLAMRHEALRTTVNADGNAIQFSDSLDVPVDVIDLSELDGTNRVLCPSVQGSAQVDVQNLSVNGVEAVIEQEMRTPFLLETGPLVRAKICTLPNRETQVILTLHHIICDGWSFGILLTELQSIYNAILNNEHVDLPDPDSYEKYSSLEQKVSSNSDLNYWLQQHTPPANDLDLPVDFPRPTQRTYDAERIDTVIDQALTERLRALAKQTKTGFFALNYAAFCAYVSRLSQKNDFVIGVPYAGQLSSGMMQLVGHCVNVLPFRITVKEKQSFTEFLKELNDQLLTGFDHPNVTMGSLLSAMTVSRDASRIPLIPITFNLDKDIGDLSFAEHPVSFSSNVRAAEPFELAFNLEDRGDILVAQWSFNKHLFSSETMQFRAQAFVELLEHIVDSADTLITELPIVSTVEKACFERWNNTDKDITHLLAVTAGFDQACQQYPNKVAIKFNDNTLTYADAQQRIDQIAYVLKQKVSCSGRLIGLYLHRTEDLPLTMMAVMKIGCAYVPLDPHQPDTRLAHILEDAQVSCLVGDTELPATIAAAANNTMALDAIEAYSPSMSESSYDDIDLSDLAYVIYTSGSTGKPKGVAVKHLGLANILRSFQQSPGFSPDDSLLAITTAAFDIAALELFLPLVTGATLCIASENTAQDPEKLSDLLAKYEISVLQCVPTTWRLLLSYGNLPSGLRGWCGGEALPSDLATLAVNATAEFWNVYGPTETTIWSTIQKVTASENNLCTKPTSIGHPIDNTRIYILDEHKQPAPIGVAGMLWIGGAGVAQGYHNRSDLTAESFQINHHSDTANDIIYHTGDMARFNHDGSLDYLGRQDFQVKIRGFRIELGDIESTLLTHNSVNSCVVHADVDANNQPMLIAYIEAEETQAIDRARLREHVAKTLPAYMIPAYFVTVDTFPLNTNGKVDRSKLPKVDQLQQEQNLSLAPSSHKVFVAPENDLESTVISQFQKYLNMTKVSMVDDFFENGGDSMSAVRLAVELNKELDLKLPLAVLLHSPTPKELVKKIQQDGGNSSIKSIVHLRKQKNGLPVFCLMGIHIYSHLADALGEGFDVYALLGKKENDFLQNMFATEDEGNVLDILGLADEYTELILSTNVSGPYHLLGFSSGGVVAIEVAKRLRAQGKEVNFVGLLDTILPRGVVQSKVQRVKSYLKTISKRLVSEHSDSDTQRKAQLDKNNIGNASYARDLLRKRGDLLWQSIEEWDRADQQYQGKTVLFRASDLSDVGGVHFKEHLGWEDVLTQKLQVFDVSSNHANLLNLENVQGIAEQLKMILPEQGRS